MKKLYTKGKIYKVNNNCFLDIRIYDKIWESLYFDKLYPNDIFILLDNIPENRHFKILKGDTIGYIVEMPMCEEI